ncbi:methylated-DNA-protein-cysteine methyltransferase-like protein [Halomonas campaniensis]|uniref:Methylated-DNA-protein-cysteine methyltransferase-like protein n=1 Tax=Halomonas campaniensis TaxID=213554 RepID=A0A7W5K602_9GAMM|nr:MGMT family protein [Halomonas campaniensis]MBB3332544.1 methylated-DNA-protein-cysteine methyltransferase-like protein [Halomonas campaniensis]
MKPVLREQILTILAAIPPGRVTTYGRIAAMTEGATPRLVARALRELPEGHGLPWFRVITASRRLADHPGATEQRERLAAEGVVLDARGRAPAERLWP